MPILATTSGEALSEGERLERIDALAERDALEQLAAAKMLQRSLLPGKLPPIAGLELAARYVPGEGDSVGGDWYDVFTLDSGHVGMVVGDVVGHGLPAAIVMGRLRSALRAYALTDLDPGRVVTQLDRKLRHFEDSQMATLLYAVFDPMLEKVRVSSAGHLPAMLATPAAPTVQLDVPADPPLGAALSGQRRTTAFDVTSGALLCLYTDGLVERRGAHIDDGLALLRGALRVDEPEQTCSTLMAELVGEVEPRDDIAILVARREEPRARRSLVLPAAPASLARVRMALRRWLAGTGAAPVALDDLVVAVGEAAANCIKHAYGPAGGTVEVELTLDKAEATVTVTDTGRWRPPRGDAQTRGMMLMEQCSDDLQVAPAEGGGTVVTIRRQLGREDNP